MVIGCGLMMSETDRSIGREHELYQDQVRDMSNRALLPAVESLLIQVDGSLQFIPPNPAIEYELAMTSARVIVAGAAEGLVRARVKLAEKIDAEDQLVEQVDSICDIIFGENK